MKGYTFEQSYHISYFDVDKNQNLKLPILLDMCSNTSTLQSEHLGIGLDYLKEHNFVWIFLKIKLEMYRVPKFQETITIRTYCSGAKRFFASREFQVFDQGGQLIAFAQGLYCLIDLATRKPMSIPPEQVKAYGQVDTTVALKDFKPKPIQSGQVDTFQVRFSHIDTNGHMNNTVYANWGLDCLPLAYLEEKTLSSIAISFEKELLLGQTAHVHTLLAEDCVAQTFYNESGQATTHIAMEFV